MVRQYHAITSVRGFLDRAEGKAQFSFTFRMVVEGSARPAPLSGALRRGCLRMYVLCSECAHLIDLAEGNRPRRDVESTDGPYPVRCRGTRGLAGSTRHPLVK